MLFRHRHRNLRQSGGPIGGKCPGPGVSEVGWRVKSSGLFIDLLRIVNSVVTTKLATVLIVAKYSIDLDWPLNLSVANQIS